MDQRQEDMLAFSYSEVNTRKTQEIRNVVEQKTQTFRCQQVFLSLVHLFQEESWKFDKKYGFILIFNNDFSFRKW